MWRTRQRSLKKVKAATAKVDDGEDKYAVDNTRRRSVAGPNNTRLGAPSRSRGTSAGAEDWVAEQHKARAATTLQARVRERWRAQAAESADRRVELASKFGKDWATTAGRELRSLRPSRAGSVTAAATVGGQASRASPRRAGSMPNVRGAHDGTPLPAPLKNARTSSRVVGFLPSNEGA